MVCQFIPSPAYIFTFNLMIRWRTLLEIFYSLQLKKNYYAIVLTKVQSLCVTVDRTL
nr:MAG TPA: hypothetical protein [Caudoviricetes sp.]